MLYLGSFCMLLAPKDQSFCIWRIIWLQGWLFVPLESFLSFIKHHLYFIFSLQWSEKWHQKCSLRLAAWAGAPWWSAVVPLSAVAPLAAVVDPRLPRLLILTPRKPFPHLQLFNRDIFSLSFEKRNKDFDTQRRNSSQKYLRHHLFFTKFKLCDKVKIITIINTL